MTYRGVKISANLPDDEYIFRQVRSIYSVANKLKAIFSKCSYMVKNMLVLQLLYAFLSLYTFFGLINKNYSGFFLTWIYFTTCEFRQKPEKHYATKSHKIIVYSHIDSMGLYWDKIDHHIKNV